MFNIKHKFTFMVKMEKIGVASLLVVFFVGAVYGSPTGVDDCAQCQNMITNVNMMLGGNAEKIVSVLCSKMSSESTDMCSELGQLSPSKICQKLGRCVEESLKYEPEPELSTDLDLDTADSRLENIPCLLCQNIMKIAHAFLSCKDHQKFLLHMMKSVCHFVPFLQKQCNNFVDNYGPMAIRLAVHFLTPESCKLFHLCPAGLVAVQDECKLCEFGVGVIYDTVQDPALETRLEEFTQEMCDEYVGDDEECKSIAEELTQYLLPMAEELRHSDFFRHACEKAKICSADEVTVY